MKSLPAVIAVMTAALLATSAVRGQETKAPPSEMKVLHRMVGVWKGEATSKVAEWTPEETHEKLWSKTDLTLGGHFLTSRGLDSEGKVSQIHLFTYDKEQQAYRRWFFDSNGSTVEHVGKWDEGSDTFTLKNEKRGITNVVSMHFVDEDTVQFSVVSKDRQGKVYFDMHGKTTRQK
jgi:Protein of unknown function (DUF1579)